MGRGARSVSVEKEKKWEELKPFFDEVKTDFGDLLLIQISIKTRRYSVNALFENIKETDLNKWTGEGLSQLHYLVVGEVTLEDLNNALQNAKNSVEGQKKAYLDVLRKYDGIIKDIAESKVPYLTVNDLHFPVTNINKEIQGQSVVNEELDKEITILLLANATIKELEDTLKNYIPKSKELWEAIQPQLAKTSAKQTLIFSVEKRSLFFANALFEEKKQPDYYELMGSAKHQLWILAVVKISDTKQLIQDLGLNSTAQTPTQETNQENTDSILSEINSVLTDILKLKPDLEKIRKINLNGEEYDIYIESNTNEKFLLKNQKVQSNQDVLNQLKNYLANINNNQKTSKNQDLAIGLGTAGGVVALAGVGGFAYWFLKIRKS